MAAMCALRMYYYFQLYQLGFLLTGKAMGLSDMVCKVNCGVTLSARSWYNSVNDTSASFCNASSIYFFIFSESPVTCQLQYRMHPHQAILSLVSDLTRNHRISININTHRLPNKRSAPVISGKVLRIWGSGTPPMVPHAGELTSDKHTPHMFAYPRTEERCASWRNKKYSWLGSGGLCIYIGYSVERFQSVIC